jgi:hypothetical protein
MWAMVLAGLVFAAAAADAATYAGPKVLLKQRYTPGTYVMSATMESSQEGTANGQPQPQQQMSQTMVMKMDVSQPDAQGVRTMQITFQRVAQQATAGQMKMAFDSAGPADQQDPNLGAFLRPLLGAQIVVKLGADDQIQSVSGLNQLWDAAAQQNAQLAPMFNQMKSVMGDETIKGMIASASQMFPPQPVGPGDTWQPGQPPSALPAGVETKQTCKLMDIETGPAGRVAVIQADATTQSSKETATNMGGMNATIHGINSRQSGVMRFSIDTGLVESQTMNQDGTTDVSVNAPNGQTMRMTTKQTAKMTLTARKEGAPGAAPAPTPAPAAAPSSGAPPAGGPPALAPLK